MTCEVHVHYVLYSEAIILHNIILCIVLYILCTSVAVRMQNYICILSHIPVINYSLRAFHCGVWLW